MSSSGYQGGSSRKGSGYQGNSSSQYGQHSSSQYYQQQPQGTDKRYSGAPRSSEYKQPSYYQSSSSYRGGAPKQSYGSSSYEVEESSYEGGGRGRGSRGGSYTTSYSGGRGSRGGRGRGDYSGGNNQYQSSQYQQAEGEYEQTAYEQPATSTPANSDDYYNQSKNNSKKADNHGEEEIEDYYNEGGYKGASAGGGQYSRQTKKTSYYDKYEGSGGASKYDNEGATSSYGGAGGRESYSKPYQGKSERYNEYAKPEEPERDYTEQKESSEYQTGARNYQDSYSYSGRGGSRGGAPRGGRGGYQGGRGGSRYNSSYQDSYSSSNGGASSKYGGGGNDYESNKSSYYESGRGIQASSSQPEPQPERRSNATVIPASTRGGRGRIGLTQSHSEHYGQRDVGIVEESEAQTDTGSQAKTNYKFESSHSEAIEDYKSETRSAVIQKPTRGASRFGGPANLDTRTVAQTSSSNSYQAAKRSNDHTDESHDIKALAQQPPSQSHRRVVYNPNEQEQRNFGGPAKAREEVRESRSSSSWASVDDQTIDQSSSAHGTHDNSSIEQSIEKPKPVAKIEVQPIPVLTPTPIAPKKTSSKDKKEEAPPPVEKPKVGFGFGRSTKVDLNAEFAKKQAAEEAAKAEQAKKEAEERALAAKQAEVQNYSQNQNDGVYHIPSFPDPEYKELQHQRMNGQSIPAVPVLTQNSGDADKYSMQMQIQQQMQDFSLQNDQQQYYQQHDISPSNGVQKSTYQRNGYSQQSYGGNGGGGNHYDADGKWQRPTTGYRQHIQQARSSSGGFQSPGDTPGGFMQTDAPNFVPTQNFGQMRGGYRDALQQDETQQYPMMFNNMDDQQLFTQDGDMSPYGQMMPGGFDPSMGGGLNFFQDQFGQYPNGAPMGYDMIGGNGNGYPGYQDSQFQPQTSNTLDVHSKEFIPSYKKAQMQQQAQQQFDGNFQDMYGNQPQFQQPQMFAPQQPQYQQYDPYQAQQQEFMYGQQPMMQVNPYGQQFINDGGSPMQQHPMHDPRMNTYDIMPKQLSYQFSGGAYEPMMGQQQPPSVDYRNAYSQYPQFQQQPPVSPGNNMDQDYFEPSGQHHQVDQLLREVDDGDAPGSNHH